MREPLGVPELGTVLIAHPGAELYGSDRVMLETLAGLVERQWRVVLVVPSDGPLLAAARDLGAETLVLDVPVLRKAMLRPRNLPGFVLGSLTGLRRALRLMGRLRPDAVYVSTLTVPLWTVAARLRRLPVLAHVHESERSAHPLLREALAAPLLLASRIVVNSRHSLDALTEAVPALAGRSVVVYNGVPGPDAVPLPRASLPGPLRVLYVGRVSPRKGVDVAVEAIGALVRDGLDARLDVVGGVFAGYEWYEEQLHRQVADLGITDRVHFHGFRSGVWDFLAAADVAVVPSRVEEPFGNTAVEAMLAARPLVVSAIGGLAEAVSGSDSAVTVEPDSAADLARALRRIAEDWTTFRRAAVAAAPVTARRYSPERYRAALAAELDRVLDPASSPGAVPAELRDREELVAR